MAEKRNWCVLTWTDPRPGGLSTVQAWGFGTRMTRADADGIVHRWLKVMRADSPTIDAVAAVFTVARAKAILTRRRK